MRSLQDNGKAIETPHIIGYGFFGKKMSQTILALDYGTKKIGLAVGETLTGGARPLLTLFNRQGQADWPKLAQIIAEWQPDVLLVGLPLREDGAETASSQRARHFMAQLQQRFPLPVQGVNEYLSSHAAAERLEIYGKKKRQPSLDAVAAQIILETWLGQIWTSTN